MTLVGVGIDVVDLSRVVALKMRYGKSFERRWFDPSEVTDRSRTAVTMAKCLAVKEAVWKALPHAAPGPLPWRNIVARPDPDAGGWTVELFGAVRADAERRGIDKIAVAITQDRIVTVAVALVEAGTAEPTRSGASPD